jgi:hypothetical protein
MRPMSEFDPTKPLRVHDELNDNGLIGILSPERGRELTTLVCLAHLVGRTPTHWIVRRYNAKGRKLTRRLWPTVYVVVGRYNTSNAALRNAGRAESPGRRTKGSGPAGEPYTGGACSSGCLWGHQNACGIVSEREVTDALNVVSNISRMRQPIGSAMTQTPVAPSWWRPLAHHVLTAASR